LEGKMPPGVRWLVLTLVGSLCAGALYLIAARGEALIFDLGKLGSVLCF
jgi:hypothetical protein